MSINISNTSCGTNKTCLSRGQRHLSFIQPSTWVHCYHPTELNTDTQNDCLYVRNNPRCKEYVQLINYLEFIVCEIGASSSISGLIQIFACTSVLLCIYIIALLVIGRYFLIPNILTMNKIFRFPDFEFGFSIVTLLLLYCDFIEALLKTYTYQGMASLEISENLGEVLCTLSVGIIVLGFSKKFYHCEMSHFLRLIFMLFFGFIYLICILIYKQEQDERDDYTNRVEVNLKIHSVVMVLIYVVVLLFTVTMIERIPKDQIKKLEEQSFDHQNRLLPEDRQLLMHMYTFNPFANIKNWKLPAVLIATPLWILAAIQIPVVDQNRPLNGWNRNAVLISFLTFPLVLWTYLNFRITLYIGLSVGVIAAVFTYCTTEVDRKPSFHEIYAIYGVVVATFWVYLIDLEIENIVWQLATYLGNWSVDTIILTVFPAAFGIIEYTISSSLASQGRGELAFGVLSGVCIFWTYTPLALVVFLVPFKEFNKTVITANTYTGFVFILLILVYAMIYAFMVRYEFRRSFGYAILTEYVIYLIVMVLSELEMIHPYGSTHVVLKGKDQSEYWS